MGPNLFLHYIRLKLFKPIYLQLFELLHFFLIILLLQLFINELLSYIIKLHKNAPDESWF